MTIRISRVGHVVLNVRALERSVAFYAGVLGLREVARMDDRMVFFSATGENHHDLAINCVGAKASAPVADGVGMAHVALKIGDTLEVLRAAKAALDRAGVPIVRIENHRVSQSIYVHDPDGNEIELFVDADPRVWREDPTAVASVLPLEL